MCDGRLLEGNLGRAGHLGHISLDPNGPPDIVNTPGSLEDLIGEHSLEKPQRRKIHLDARSGPRTRKRAMRTRAGSGLRPFAPWRRRSLPS